MKSTIVFLLFGIFVATVSARNAIDWSKVYPQSIDANVKAFAGSDSVSGRITNGKIAAPGEFPYQVGLLLYMQEGGAWCGGSILSDRWVLTAAHCTQPISTGLDVYLGAWNRQDPNEEGQQIIYVSKKYIIVHENYDPAMIRNDISLIKLPVKIQFNKYIQPAVLPKMSTEYSTYAGQNAIASGWGRTSDASQGATDKLQWIEVPIMTNSACSRWFLGQVSNDNICIKTTDGLTSTCNGDSGGPLVLADESRTLIGLTSFGIAFGCEKGWPGVFTRTTSYLDWIEKHSGLANH